MENVAVYWNDVHKYRGEADRRLTKMLSEGTLIKETDRYIILKNPETITLTDSVHNHPQEKASFYYIPRSFITKIEKLEK